MRSKSIALGWVALLVGCVGYRTPLDELGRRDAAIPCVPGRFALARAEPLVMFVLDRSTSMSLSMAGARSDQTRWQALGTALAGVLPAVDNAVAIGALLFPSSGSGQLSCSVGGRADLEPAVGNVAALNRLVSGSTPGGATPTAAAIDRAAGLVLGMRTATAARALILATDGAPNCNQGLDPRTCRCTNVNNNRSNVCQDGARCLDAARTVASLSTHQAQGLPTYVVGIQSQGDTEFSDVLSAMAVAGGRPRLGAAESYYAATSQAELGDALATIRDQVGACTFLTLSVPDPSGSIVLNLDSTDLGPEQWGWGNQANGEIILLGDACQTAAAETTPALTAVVQCTEG